MPQSKTFCVLPWMHVATSPGGSYRVCCNSDPKNNKLNYRDTTQQLKMHKHGVDEIHKSSVMRDIRETLLNGEQPATCSRCFTQEAANVKSSRQIYNERWITEREYNIDDKIVPTYLDLRLGNLCNLKCRMCNPYSSNQWVDEWEQLHGKFDDDERKWLLEMEWPNFAGTSTNLEEMVESAEEIYFTGGEPTIIKRHEQLLDYCIENNLAKDITLKYNTNLTNTPVRLINKWQHFKFLRLNCSIDGIGEVNDYIRYPSKWRGVWKNYNEVLNRTSNRVLDIHTTVQVTNVLHLHKVIEQFVQRDEGTDWSTVPFIFFNLLDHPSYLNIKILPNELKQLVQERIEPWVDHPDLDTLQGVLDYMWHDDWSDQWPDFVKHTNELDKLRNQKLIDIVPEFKEWM